MDLLDWFWPLRIYKIPNLDAKKAYRNIQKRHVISFFPPAHTRSYFQLSCLLQNFEAVYFLSLCSLSFPQIRLFISHLCTYKVSTVLLYCLLLLHVGLCPYYYVIGTTSHNIFTKVGMCTHLTFMIWKWKHSFFRHAKIWWTEHFKV